MRISRVSAAFILAASAAYGACALAENGVGASQILIGQSASLTGTAAESSQQTRDGALAYFEVVNRKGGVNGRKINLITLDDGGQTKRGEENTGKLIAEDKVFLLFGYTGRNTSEAALPIITKANIPFFGAATGGETIHGAFNKNVFNVRASYKLETLALVNYLVITGQTKIGMIYNAAVKPLSEFVKQMRTSGAASQFLSVSFVGSAIVKELKSEAAGVIMAQVVPLPTKKGIPIVAEYHNALAAVGAKPDYSFSGLEGFISAKVLVEGLKRSGKAPTRAGFIKSMEGIGDLDLGDYFVSYSPTNHNGSKYVDITVINKAGLFFN